MKNRLNMLSAAFDRLSGREQLMLLFVGAGALAIILTLSGFLISSDLKARENRIAAKMKKLEELNALRADYQRKLADQNRLAEQIRGNNNMRLLSFIEDVSKASAIDLGNATERQGSGNDLLREEGAEVLVKNVSIDRLFDFLKRVEESNPLVKVRRLKVQKRYDNPQRLDATITVGTFKLKEGG